MKILGTLTVDTADALDKVTDFNADLLDGKSSETYLSRGKGDFDYVADYTRTSADDNTIDTSIILGRTTQLVSTTTKVANTSLILNTGGLTNGATSTIASSLTLFSNGDSPNGSNIISGSSGLLNTAGALILNNNSSGDFLIKQGDNTNNAVRLRIADKITYLGNFTNSSIGSDSATYANKFNTVLIIGTPDSTSTKPSIFIGDFGRTVGGVTVYEASIAGIDFGSNVLCGLSVIGKSIVFRTDDAATVSDTTISDRMVIGSTGLVGIGLANPDSMLHIKAKAATNLVKFTDSSNNVRFAIDSSGRVGFGSQGVGTDRLMGLTFTGVTTSGTSQYGIVLNPTYISSSNFTNLFNFYTGVNVNLTAGVTLANSYGIYVDVGSYVGGTVNNKYGIYQAGSADANYFNGVTTVNSSLTVTGAVTFSATTQNIAIGGSQTTGTLTLGSASQTGTITIGQSTYSQTLNLGCGVTTSGYAKTINIGASGVGSSTTNINYGSSTGTIHNFSGNVGIGTSSPATKLDVQGSSSSSTNWIWAGGNVLNPPAGCTYGVLLGRNLSGGFSEANIVWGQGISSNQFLGFGKWTGSAYTEQMRLDSSGNVGIGTISPSARLSTSTARSATVTSADFGETGTGAVNDVNKITLRVQNTLGGNTGGSGIGAILEASASNKTGLGFYYDNGSGVQTEGIRLDSRGNVGVGVTPSDWYISWNALQGAAGKSFAIASSGSGMYSINNAYLDASAVFRYQTSGYASYYQQIYSQHSWYTAPSGTAGNAITFTQAMRLNSTGNLLIGTTTDDGVNKLQVNGGVISSSVNGTFEATGTTGWSGFTATKINGQVIFGLDDGITFGEADGSVIIRNTNGKGLYYKNLNTTRFVIAPDGNVGIGTSVPTEKLDVTGNAKVSGTLSVTGAITAANIFTGYQWSFTIAATNTASCTIMSNAYDTNLCSSSAFYARNDLSTSLGTTRTGFATYLVCVYMKAGTNWEIVYPDIVIESGGIVAITFAANQSNNIFKVVMV